MQSMEINLKEICLRIISDLGNCTNQDKRDAYTYLDLKIKSTPEGTVIKGYLDSSVRSGDSCVSIIEQSSGCLIVVDVSSNAEQSVSILPTNTKSLYKYCGTDTTE